MAIEIKESFLKRKKIEGNEVKNKKIGIKRRQRSHKN